jgi:uncharacterized protein (TIGR04255 family)
MSNYPTLKNPPIVEAILDVQVIFPQGVELSALASLHENFQSDYPQKNEERIVQFGFEHQAGEPPKALAQDQGVRGYRFISKDGKQIVQCRKDGFTFNRLSPYVSWNDVIKFAKPAWSLYQKTFPDMVITRVALRYINKVLLPMVNNKVKIEDYFRTDLPGPKMDELSYSGFLSQGIFRDQVTGFEANWIFAHQPSSDPTKMGIVLDIDVSASGATVQEEDVANLWEKQRDLKNRLFFGSFTAKGLDLFE